MNQQDFGDYLESYYSVQTNEGEKISQLIAGYIDIILKKVKKNYKSRLFKRLFPCGRQFKLLKILCTCTLNAEYFETLILFICLLLDCT